MDAKQFEGHIQAIRAVIGAHDPDPTRGDWLGHVKALDAKLASASWLLAHFGELAEIVEPRRLDDMRGYVLELVAAFAALLACAQRHAEARTLIGTITKLAPPSTRPGYAAALDDMPTYIRLTRARWLVAQGRLDEGRALAQSLRGAQPLFAALARPLERAPDASAGPPTNFTLNGFGTRMYFDSEHDAGGSVIRTRFVTALFVPIVPIDAWRVTDAPEGDGFYVHGKVPLTRGMRIWQASALALLLAAIGGSMVASWLDSPERALDRELDAIAAIEQGDPDEALQRLELAAIRYSDLDDVDALERLAARWVAVVGHELPHPLTLDDLGAALDIVARFEALPDRFHAAPLRDPMLASLLGWIDELGHADQDHASASLELAHAAARVAPNDPRVADRLRSARVAIAEHLADEWPIEAILQYASLAGDPAADARVLALLRELPASPTLFVDIGPELRTWADAASVRDEAGWALALVEQGQALLDDPARRAMLERGDAAELEQALAAAPDDQILVVALARLERSRGELDAAHARLRGLGEPGRMVHVAQFLLASIEFDRGELDTSAELFSRMLTSRLPAFEAMRRAYFDELGRLETQLISKAEAGNAPSKYAARLADTDAEVSQAAFSEWFAEELERSPTLPRLREGYMRRSDVVEVAVSLGSVQLAAARAAEGAEQQRLLDAAERTFLSFRDEASGLPDYHASLAQVYYRLGKVAESEAEFQILLDDPDPAVQVLAAAGQRELGRVEQARTIAEQIYARAESPLRESVAGLRATMALDLEDRATWLGRADATQPFVRANLLEVEGDRLRLAGDCRAADRKYAEAHEIALGEVARGASPNNAALLLLARHTCTGDLRYVDAAAELLATALAGAPDDPIIMHNYATVLDTQLALALLDELVDSEGLQLSSGTLDAAIYGLLASSKHDELVATLRASPQWRQLRDLLARLATLAPSMDDPLRREYFWLSVAEDEDGLRDLLARVERVDLDVSSQAAAHADFLSGKSDTLGREHFDANIAGRAGSKPRNAMAEAMLAHLDGVELESRAWLHEDPSESLTDLRAAKAAFERSAALWPGGPAGALADVLVNEALLELAVEQPEFAQLWKSLSRESLTVLVDVLLDDHEELAGALAAKPNLQQGVQLRARLPERRLGSLDLMLAELTANAELRARASAALRSEQAQLERKLDGILDAYDPFEAQVAAIVDAELAGD